MPPQEIPIKARVPITVEGAVRVEGTVPAAEAAKEQALKTQGQRSVNLVWELTQALTALSITAAQIYCAVSGKESAILGNAFTLIVALYFVRTNHTKTGGVGGTDSR